MILTKKQAEGLDIAIERYRNNKRYTVISGYAGVGKTELVKFIVNALAQIDIDPEKDVAFCSYTGKATLVLQQKGNKNAMTLHKLLYDTKPRADGTFIYIPKRSLNYKIIIVDECSMMPRRMLEQLFTYEVYCIFCGDPAQLPPVSKDDDNKLLEHPHIFLDEIMRQAAESEIIQLSMAIRENRLIKPKQGRDVIVMNHSQFNTGVMTWADQLLCATNKTRVKLNLQMRRLLGRGEEPESGDRLICLHNYDHVISDDGNILVNGVTGVINNCYKSYVEMPKWIGASSTKVDTLEGVFVSDLGDSYNILQMDYNEISTGERSLDNKTLYRLNKPKTKHLIPLDFTYGYAITGHKSQGSEWEKVVVIEEKFPFDAQEHCRWLYTCCTRASEKLVLILKE